MRKSRIFYLLALLVVASILLATCGGVGGEKVDVIITIENGGHNAPSGSALGTEEVGQLITASPTSPPTSTLVANPSP